MNNLFGKTAEEVEDYIRNSCWEILHQVWWCSECYKITIKDKWMVDPWAFLICNTCNKKMIKLDSRIYKYIDQKTTKLTKEELVEYLI